MTETIAMIAAPPARAQRLKPAYFDDVKQQSVRRWDHLERDPDLAAPWWQLFRQVQSPRHVLSELLQNADDAGASAVRAYVDGDCFVFEHDGEDFSREQFASLCKFGNSNKRKLHTIGFRGIGFKSTFSIGDVVDVLTPTLAVRFRSSRFTDPIWMETAPEVQGTVIRVRFADEERKHDVEASFRRWAKSPASLLFFSNVRTLQLGRDKYEKSVLAPGPAPGTQRIALETADGRLDLLVVRSRDEEFPPSALQEVRDERGEAALELPPCSVELVLGLPESGRLYVVLPTDVTADVPFCVNAPFVQDPARTGLKAPSRSATNRWLLGRAGQLAAETLVAWLGNSSLSVRDRAAAYALLPSMASQANEAGRECDQRVREAFSSGLTGAPLALDSSGAVVPGSACIAPPLPLYSVWSADGLRSAFAPERAVLVSEVQQRDRTRVAYWTGTTVVSDEAAIESLKRPGIPKPPDWERLARLWRWVETTVRGDYWNTTRRALHLVPVVGSDVLAKGDETVRLPTDTKAFAPNDWEYLVGLLTAVDPSWIAFLLDEQQKRPAERELLRVLGHERATSTDQLALRAYSCLMQRSEVAGEDLLRLTRLLAKLDATVPPDFRYATRDSKMRPIAAGLAFDPSDTLAELLPEAYATEHLLHGMYLELLDRADGGEIVRWLRSEKSGLVATPIVQPFQYSVYGEFRLGKLLQDRNCEQKPQLQRKSTSFIVDDFDFMAELLEHWTTLSQRDASVWAKVVRQLLTGEARYWASRLRASVVQRTSQGNDYGVGITELLPAWIQRLRCRRCLFDTHGAASFPADLLVRTPQTDEFRDLEPFVDAALDTPANRPLLLLLGARDSPSNPTAVLESIRALASQQGDTVIQQATRRYAQLDSLFLRLSGAEQAEVRDRFHNEALILTASLEWKRAHEVVQDRGDFAPDSLDVIHPCGRGLPLWTRLKVAEKPGEEFLLSWVSTLPHGRKLDGADLKRLRAALSASPHAIWEHCRGWLSLGGSWEPRDTLKYRLTMKGLVSWTHLFEDVKATVADMRMLSSEIAGDPRFAALDELGPRLSTAVTEVVEAPSAIERFTWVEPLATYLGRVQLNDGEETAVRVQTVAARLQRTQTVPFNRVLVTPFIDRVQAGTSFAQRAIWAEDVFYVQAIPLAAVIDDVTGELSRPFQHQAITDAITACVARSEEFIGTYFETHFDLREDAAPRTSTEQVGEGAGGTEPEISISPMPATGGQAEDGDLERSAGGHHPRRDPLPAIDAFARSLGFTRNADGTYVSPTGSKIVRNLGLGWDGYDPRGDHVARYFVASGSLESGLELPAEIWFVFESDPDIARLVVRHGGVFKQYTGRTLLSLRERGSLDVHAARFRMRLRRDRPGA